MKRRNWIILGIALLAVAAFAGWRLLHPAPKIDPYKTAVLAKGDLTEVITANGVINPVRVVSVGTQVSGTVAALYTDFNAKVSEGQVLLKLDPSVFAARLAASRAALANIRATAALQSANAARSATLFKQDYISRQDFETSRASAVGAAAQVTQAEAQIKQDETNLGYTVIRSPVSGVVISRQVDLGQTVAASFNTPTLFQIARDLTRMQIEAAVAEADIAKVKQGQNVDFTVDAYGSRKFQGVVTEIRLNPTTQQNVVTYTVIVSVANPDGALLPGMTANATFVVSEKKDVLLVPNAALSYKPEGWKPGRRGGGQGAGGGWSGRGSASGGASGGSTGGWSGQGGGRPGSHVRDPDAVTVFILENGQPAPRRFHPGASDADFTEVERGRLKEGDVIITGSNVLDKKKGGLFSGPPGGQSQQRGANGRGGAPAV